MQGLSVVAAAEGRSAELVISYLIQIAECLSDSQQISNRQDVQNYLSGVKYSLHFGLLQPVP